MTNDVTQELNRGNLELTCFCLNIKVVLLELLQVADMGDVLFFGLVKDENVIQIDKHKKVAQIWAHRSPEPGRQQGC